MYRLLNTARDDRRSESVRRQNDNLQTHISPPCLQKNSGYHNDGGQFCVHIGKLKVKSLTFLSADN